MAVSNTDKRVVIFGAQGDSTTVSYHVRWFVWVKPTAAGDDLLLTGVDGKTIRWSCGIANQSQLIPFGDVFKGGFTVTTMDSGALEAYLA
jgi:hypothetical protein